LDHSTAAAYLSTCLQQLGYHHAYIGGFAWALLGSSRSTQDIDVLIEAGDSGMKDLREKLLQLSQQFASVALKFYFVKELKCDLTGEALVRASENNVLIETLSAGSLGLPTVAEPTYRIEHESGMPIEILHPGVLLLTKMKRWYHHRDSTHPKSVAKRNSDKRDLDFMVTWLADNKMTIEFDKYQGKPRDELLRFVQYYWEQIKDDKDLVEDLQKAMKPEDWALL